MLLDLNGTNERIHVMWLKEKAKKIKPLVNAYHKYDYEKRRWMSIHMPVTLSKQLYKKIFHRNLNLEDPKYFNEKLMWLKLYKYTDNPLVTSCIDKYKVRKYVKRCGLESILNELYGVWDQAEDVEWDRLPNKFVIKCNHGCGFNIICRDKNNFNTAKATHQLDEWMHKESWTEFAETNYRGIEKKIICEKFLEGVNGALPVDYKFYCFNGEPKYIGNFIERNMEADTLVRGYFDLDWNPSDLFKYKDKMDLSKFPKPDRLQDMIKYARVLSKPFPFVRVDFYDVGGKVYFGELTFSPTGCLGNYYADDAYLKLGEMLDLNEEKKNKKTLGIIGGMGPSATALLFKRIVDYTDAASDADHIHILIDNYPQIPDRTKSILEDGESPVSYITKIGKKLIDNGADLLLIPCNTSHYYFKDIQRNLTKPVVNMIYETAKQCQSQGIKRVGVLATAGTIKAGVFETELKKFDIECVYPTDTDEKYVMDMIYNQVKAGNVHDLKKINMVIEHFKNADIHTMILGCTELSIVISEGYMGMHVIDTLDVLACTAIKDSGYKLKKINNSEELLNNNLGGVLYKTITYTHRYLSIGIYSYSRQIYKDKNLKLCEFMYTSQQTRKLNLCA